jgi:hypothetical protein
VRFAHQSGRLFHAILHEQAFCSLAVLRFGCVRFLCHWPSSISRRIFWSDQPNRNCATSQIKMRSAPMRTGQLHDDAGLPRCRGWDYRGRAWRVGADGSQRGGELMRLIRASVRPPPTAVHAIVVRCQAFFNFPRVGSSSIAVAPKAPRGRNA